MEEISLQTKMAIKELLASGKKYPYISSLLNLNLRTVEKWGLIIKKGGDLNPPIGRPSKGRLSTFDSQIKTQIDKYRPSEKGWSAETIKVELKLDEQNLGKKIPSESTINKYLKQKSRTAPRRKRVALPLNPVFPATYAHQLWQMDAEGNTAVDNIGTVSIINIKDVFSRTVVQIYPCLLKGKFNHPTTIDYQTAMRLGFINFGLCKHLQVDHDSIYFDNVNASPFPTNFHLWLIGLGIELHFTPKGRPQKQGMIEKSHQTTKRQVLPVHEQFSDWIALFDYCNFRRNRLNYHLPCRMLEDKAPLVYHPQAIFSVFAYKAKDEERLFDIHAIRRYLSQLVWYRTSSKSRTVTLANQIYYLNKTIPKQELKITYESQSDSFVFHDANDTIIDRKLSKGLNFKELSGNLNLFIQFVSNLKDKSP